MNASQRKAVKIAKEIYGVKVIVRKLTLAGAALYTNNTITVSNNQTTQQFICTIFHEIGHIHCYRNNIYPAYHHGKDVQYLTKREKRAAMLTAWKAERYVDAWGKNEMHKYFPKLKYVSNYVDEIDKSWLHRFLKPTYK